MSKLRDEQELNKDQTDTLLTLFGQMLKRHFGKGTTLRSTEMLAYAEAATDRVAAKRNTRAAYPAVGGVDSDSDSDCPCPFATSDTKPDCPSFAQGLGATVSESGSDQERPAELPEVDIWDPDECIYVVLDESCNNTCHGGAWGGNTYAELEEQ